MTYAIEITASAYNELKSIRPFYRQRILDTIDQQLMNQPTFETRNRKPVSGAKPDFEHVPPLWQLRVEQFRVFYDVNADENAVLIRAVREKPLHASTEEII